MGGVKRAGYVRVAAIRGRKEGMEGAEEIYLCWLRVTG
jgi:hypothetical protein